MVEAVDEIVSYWKSEGTPPFLFMEWLQSVEWSLVGAMDACTARLTHAEAEATRPVTQKRLDAITASLEAVNHKRELVAKRLT